VATLIEHGEKMFVTKNQLCKGNFGYRLTSIARQIKFL